MSQFTSSTKPLLSFAQTPTLEKLTARFGDRLSELTQCEKYQVTTAIGLYLWGLSEDIENPTPYPCDDGVDDDIHDVAKLYMPFGLSKPVHDALGILKDEDPNNLACIMGPIAEYAKEDTRLHP
jgi:hypothetical protein